MSEREKDHRSREREKEKEIKQWGAVGRQLFLPAVGGANRRGWGVVIIACSRARLFLHLRNLHPIAIPVPNLKMDLSEKTEIY